jgi:hypothetical protein
MSSLRSESKRSEGVHWRGEPFFIGCHLTAYRSLYVSAPSLFPSESCELSFYLNGFVPPAFDSRMLGRSCLRIEIHIHSNNHVKKMTSTTENEFQTSVAARIAGEDIQLGDYISVASEIIELPSYLWSCSGSILAIDEPVRTRFLPREAGHPFKVIAVCLPFVYAKRACGKLATFDIRNQQLVRLDRETGRKIWKEMRSAMNR